MEMKDDKDKIHIVRFKVSEQKFRQQWHFQTQNVQNTLC